MSDTNKTDGQHGESALMQLWMAMSGASSGHHEEAPGLDKKSVVSGHEPDTFGVKAIIYVPIAVMITIVMTYIIVTGAFKYVNSTGGDAIASNDPTTNERFARISSTQPVVADPAKADTAVGQPRLEYLRQVDKERNGQIDPPYLRSFRPIPTGNSPEIYPQDLEPARYVDPTTRKKSLIEFEWIDKAKNIAQIPIAKAIESLLSQPELKLKVMDKPVSPVGTTANKAKLSNGGQSTPSKPKSEAPTAPVPPLPKGK